MEEFHKKKLEEFHKKWSATSDRRPQCKLCINKYQQKYQQEHRGTVNEYQRRSYYKKNKEQIDARKEQLRLAKLDKQLDKQKKHEAWEQQQAYRQTPEYKEEQRASERRRERQKYHSNPKVKKRQASARRNAVKNLTDGQIRRCLRIKLHRLLKSKDITPEMIQIQREYMLMNRLLKKHFKENA